MDRALILDHLAMAKRHVAEGEEHVERQKMLIAELARDGHDTAVAQKLLATLEQLQVQFTAERERLEREAKRLEA